MDKQFIASLGCKFLGIYALLETIPLMGNISQMYSFAYGSSEFTINFILTTSIPLLFMILSVIVLIFYSDILANRMVGIKSEENLPESLTSHEIQSIAFSVVGLVLLLLALPKIAQVGWNIYATKAVGDQRNVSEIVQKTWSFALATGVQFVIGFFLFIGADLVSTLWHRAIQRIKYERNITSKK